MFFQQVWITINIFGPNIVCISTFNRIFHLDVVISLSCHYEVQSCLGSLIVDSRYYRDSDSLFLIKGACLCREYPKQKYFYILQILPLARECCVQDMDTASKSYQFIQIFQIA